MKTKIFTLFVALLATSTLWAYDFQSGDLYYNITSSSAPYTVEVTYQEYGSGDSYLGLTTATIPETVTNNDTTYSVTSVGNWAFYDCESLTSITIPNSVTSIGDNAFIFCSSLTSITIPNSVTSIGWGAFSYCTFIKENFINNSSLDAEANDYWGAQIVDVEIDGLLMRNDTIIDCRPYVTSVTIPNSVTSIGNYAFWDCSSLTSITFPECVTSIGQYAFWDCSSLTSVTLPNSITFIDHGAFHSCSSLASIFIPQNVSEIRYDAFLRCSSLSSIIIPKSITFIGEGAFRECSSLSSIVVEDGNITYDSRENCNAIIETNTNRLMFGCSNTLIPDGVTTIGEDAFSGCSSLTSITIPNSVTSIGDGAFESCSSLTSVTIPNSVTTIGDLAFFECRSLTSITIPNSITSIGKYAFCGCSLSLTSVVVENGNTIYDSRDNSNAIIETATNTLITGCMNTVIPNSVTSIGGEAFYRCSALTSIEIPNSVTSIGKWAFYSCSFTSITIPNSVTSIDEMAFCGCFSLKEVICKAEIVPKTGRDIFSYCPTNTAILYVPEHTIETYRTTNPWSQFGMILPLEQAPSSVEDIHSPSSMTNSQKIIRDGQLLILRDDKTYNIVGQIIE